MADEKQIAKIIAGVIMLFLAMPFYILFLEVGSPTNAITGSCAMRWPAPT